LYSFKQKTKHPLAQSRYPKRPRTQHSLQTLTANLFRKLTDLFCRLPLPTFFYQLDADHIGDLMRIFVRCRKEEQELFQGMLHVHGYPRKKALFCFSRCFSLQKDSTPTRHIKTVRNTVPVAQHTTFLLACHHFFLLLDGM